GPALRSRLLPYTTLFRSEGPDPLALGRRHPGPVQIELDGHVATDGGEQLPLEGRLPVLRQGPTRLAPHLACLLQQGFQAAVLGQETGGRLRARSEEHTSELQSRENLVCRLLLEKKNNDIII